jgi:tRNA(fMet)-specific endonuclease VapC
MTERVAADSNAIIAWFRSGTEVSALRNTRQLELPLPVVGELYTGVFASARRDTNLAVLEAFLAHHRIMIPDHETARGYGRLRARLRIDNLRASKVNDLWIAALCIQHDLPLLTNDRGFDTIPNLRVLHW